eukprot:SAG11_NODE_145_length_14811_cov_24.558931_1_plen_200_part_00
MEQRDYEDEDSFVSKNDLDEYTSHNEEDNGDDIEGRVHRYIEETIRGDSIQKPIEPDSTAQAKISQTEAVMATSHETPTLAVVTTRGSTRQQQYDHASNEENGDTNDETTNRDERRDDPDLEEARGDRMRKATHTHTHKKKTIVQDTENYHKWRVLKNQLLPILKNIDKIKGISGIFAKFYSHFFLLRFFPNFFIFYIV